MDITADPNQDYIIASYAITAVVMAGVALFYIMRSRNAERKLAMLQEMAQDET